MKTLPDPFCGRTRREFLWQSGSGFTGLALTSLLAGDGFLGQQAVAADGITRFAQGNGTHFPAKAKRIIQLFQPGGPSQVDTFDYKPMLAKHAGERPSMVDRKTLRNTKNGLMPSPFGFKQYGESGKWVSDIFPKTAETVSYTHLTLPTKA